MHLRILLLFSVSSALFLRVETNVVNMLRAVRMVVMVKMRVVHINTTQFLIQYSVQKSNLDTLTSSAKRLPFAAKKYKGHPTYHYAHRRGHMPYSGGFSQVCCVITLDLPKGSSIHENTEYSEMKNY